MNEKTKPRVMKLTEELGHDTPVMALLHAKEMRDALRVIHTWSNFPPIDCEEVRRLTANALRIKS